MIEQILPPTVAVAESFTDPAGLTLFPEEQALVAASVEKRRREFTTVRHCARRALGELGIAPAPILSGARGAPVWPAGVVGSMTHCEGYRAAVLGRTAAFATLGVDAEPHAPLPDGVLEAIALPAERARTATLGAARPSVCWDRLLFSAKESVYKAWFPLTGRWLDFAEADIFLDPAGTFTAHLLVPGPVLGGAPVTAFAGRFLVARGLVVTAISVPATT
ncbi:4'-phosphopantetheinyl transferase EntD (siderophore biosynthesis) [Micromonospora citrea]|uniref:4'-phosphopantetheinyl transferase EntD (Siderophore biosynthesis) n=1 Tax=Micromonospora citrea TaxID=47855 RepID=A0A1C6W1N9_9ACTN|nr:4'-phosphopantetheinyl transferase superfamily protein [Micromonospora citrea]SCL72080.1 4'-phosphopantetheinyl transferase EntD (siderophore biosynthesis) [Micromonospora citrea]